MKLVITTPQKSLKAYKNQRADEVDVIKFKNNLLHLVQKVSEIEAKKVSETEEHFKNEVRDFLRETYYKQTLAIITKEYIDLAIHQTADSQSPVLVIIEAKRPSKTAEMITVENVNKKAFHELILYYFNERNVANNNELKRLIANNVSEWFIFDANDFDQKIYKNLKPH